MRPSHPDNYIQISHKQSISSAGEMYWRCVVHNEWADDHFSLGLTLIDRSTFNKNMSRKRFLHFRSKWPWPLTFLAPLVTLVQRYVSTKLEVPIRLSYFEKIGGTAGRTNRQADRQTDGRTDGGVTLNARLRRAVYWSTESSIQLNMRTWSIELKSTRPACDCVY